MNDAIIGILSLHDFFNGVINRLPKKFRIFSLDNYSDNMNLIQGIIATPWDKVDGHLINSLPNLKIISCFGTGIDCINIDAAINKKIIVTNTPDVVTEDTADVALALLLGLSRHIVTNDSFVRAGKWKTNPAPLGTSLRGKTIGIVGLGKIGKSIAARAITFGLKVGYCGRNKQNTSYIYYDNLLEMAKIADFLVICCPGNSGTKNIIDKNVLDSLGKNGFLINVSRGSTVNESDLLDALESNTIKGAGLDVYQSEPNVSERFFKLDNVVLLPHIGTATHETRLVMLNLVLNNIVVFFQTGNALNPVALTKIT